MDPACSAREAKLGVDTKSDQPTEGTSLETPSNAHHQRSGHHHHTLSWRQNFRSFAPSWFSVTNGTGITGIILHQLPYNGVWLRYLSYIIFALNVVTFVAFFFVSVVRYTPYPSLFKAMIRHPQQSLFVGTFPVGLATIVNMIVLACVPAWGGETWELALALWWNDAVIALNTTCYLPFVITVVHNHPKFGTMTAAWLLPIVSTIIAASSGLYTFHQMKANLCKPHPVACGSVSR